MQRLVIGLLTTRPTGLVMKGSADPTQILLVQSTECIRTGIVDYILQAGKGTRVFYRVICAVVETANRNILSPKDGFSVPRHHRASMGAGSPPLATH